MMKLSLANEKNYDVIMESMNYDEAVQMSMLKSKNYQVFTNDFKYLNKIQQIHSSNDKQKK